MRNYETYANGKFEITHFGDLGITSEIVFAVSKTEHPSETVLHLVNHDVRIIRPPDYATFLGDN
jgi:hypothetical protein